MESKVTIGLAVIVLVLAFGFSDAVTTQDPDITTDSGFAPPVADLNTEAVRGYWNYSENGEYCILVAMGIRLTFLYEGADGEDYEISYDVPAHNETVDGPPNYNGSFCDPFDRDQQRMRNRLRIHFFEEDDWILELDFFYDYDPVDGDREWYMADIDLFYNYNQKYFPMLAADVNIRQQATLDRIVFFFTDLRESYWCDSKIQTSDTDKFQFNPVDDIPGPVGPVPQRLGITAWQTRLEAFAREPDMEFHTPNRCVEDQFIAKLVPGIIGGICLASIISSITIYSFQRKAKGRDYKSDMYWEPEDEKKTDNE